MTELSDKVKQKVGLKDVVEGGVATACSYDMAKRHGMNKKGMLEYAAAAVLGIFALKGIKKYHVPDYVKTKASEAKQKFDNYMNK